MQQPGPSARRDPDPDAAPTPAPPRPRGARGPWLAGGLLALLALLCALALGYLLMVYAPQPGPGDGAAVRIELAAGDGPFAAARRLHGAGLLRHHTPFALYLLALGAADDLRAGAVWVRDDMGPGLLLRRLTRGHGGSELPVTIPEGYNRFQIAELLARWDIGDGEDFLAATVDPALLRAYGIPGDTAEGYLFPDTYRLRDDRGGRAAAQRMLDNAQRRLRALRERQRAGLSTLQQTLGWGLHEVVTLASIVELEAARADERAVIAGVFLNRLRDPAFRPHRLQADPTVAYGCRVRPALPPCVRFDGRRVTRRMTRDPENPYNTYRHAGLPPGPIGNPGAASLRAVLSPEIHDYYYFVARGDGSHAFSESLEEHLAAVERYR